MNFDERLQYILSLSEPEAEPEPKDEFAHASLLLTSEHMDDAIDLAHVLMNPKDLTKIKLSKRVRLQAERVWRQLGREIDIEVDINDDGYLEVRGNVRHAGVFVGQIIP